ncbi:hypothetical protein E1B28_002022 [Marasmius oreades]|uniref:Protein-S-isoprenylcysteine O-methyltransferase n=1 Tax=Marasmius oreades TaxID=181124 RepID=A0A9P7V4Q1_9AGAR|nr:uncharacterized protein E1B28_002022 [Marasmius oreades]KAG7100250.1 hypothetical protein E1B28_002022 [Marasmius oreades]
MDANSLGTTSRLALLIFSAYLFNRTYSPPAGTFTLPPLGPSFSEKREWFTLRLCTYVYPFLRIGYAAVTFLECLFTSMTYLKNPSSLADYPILRIPLGLSGPPGWIAMLGLLTSVFGGLFRISCYKALGDGFTFNITRSSSKLITSGPYSIVRHPAYLALSLNSAGISIYHLSPGSWLRESGLLQHNVCKAVVGAWIFIIITMNICLGFRAEDEDRLMKSMFEEEWEKWRRDVRYKIYPGLY